MTIQYDEKGKYFSQIVQKRLVFANVQTTTHRIQGNIHTEEGERLKDMLNNPDDFIAMTEVVVYDGDGSILYRADFVAVQRHHIIWVIPLDERQDGTTEEEHGS